MRRLLFTGSRRRTPLSRPGPSGIANRPLISHLAHLTWRIGLGISRQRGETLESRPDRPFFHFTSLVFMEPSLFICLLFISLVAQSALGESSDSVARWRWSRHLWKRDGVNCERSPGRAATNRHTKTENAKNTKTTETENNEKSK